MQDAQWFISSMAIVILIYVSTISSINSHLSHIRHLRYIIFPLSSFTSIKFAKTPFSENSLDLIGTVDGNEVVIGPLTSNDVMKIKNAYRDRGLNSQELFIIGIRQIRFLTPSVVYYLFTNFEVSKSKKGEV